MTFDGSLLVASNDGAPLTSDGVAALASLRASAKRDGQTVGRFGVGFAAVAAVSDEVEVRSAGESVLFSRERTLSLVSDVPELAPELGRRAGRVPLLRLPFPAESSTATEVRVVVRPDCREQVEGMLDSLDPRLLLVLPGLTSITVNGGALLDDVTWKVSTTTGTVPDSVLSTRPVEERNQTRWSVTWALPHSGTGPGVVWAPTPTDDPLSLPALLSASLPLGPDRRRVQLDALADLVLQRAADALVDLLRDQPFEPSLLAFVPPPLAAGEVDAVLGRHVLESFARLLGPRNVVLEGANPELVELLEGVIDGLLPHSWSATGWAAPLRRLGGRRVSVSELTELLASVDRPPSWWGQLYDALPPDVDQLGALPVPVSSGGMAPAPRGLLLADSHADLSPLGFRVVHPDAARDLLLRLGAQHAEPRALLEDPRVRSAVESLEDAYDDERAAVVSAVLDLVGAADVRPGELPWLAVLPLPTVDGDVRPAGELLLPGGALYDVMDRDAGFGVVAPGITHDDVLAAVGVMRDFVVVPAEDAEDVDGLQEWLSISPDPGLVVRDLDLVRPDAWARALELVPMTDYASWWLRRHPVLDGERPDRLRRKGSDSLLQGLIDESDHPLVTATIVSDIDPSVLLTRLAEPGREVGRHQLRGLYAHLAGCTVEEPPDQVRVVLGGVLAVVPAQDAVVVDRPDLLSRVHPYGVLPVPLDLAHALAEVLDVALASEVLSDASVGGSADEDGYVEHRTLEVPDAGGTPVSVAWARVGAVDHVVGIEGRARAMAWREGRWERRFAILAALRGVADPAEDDLAEF